MQIDKFYTAEGLRKDIIQIEKALALLKDSPCDLRVLDNLNVEIKKIISNKASDLVKKELQKIIRLKENEFSNL